MKTKRYDDKLGYNPNTIPHKPNTRYVVSEQSRELFDKVVGKSKSGKITSLKINNVEIELED